MFNKNQILGLGCIGICIGILVACLWPFDFWPANNVWWLADNGGLHFEGSSNGNHSNAGGIAFTPDLFTHPDTSSFNKGEISIELFLRPAVEQHKGVPKIATLYDAHNSEKLIIGQWKSHIVARLPPPDYRNEKPYREIIARTAMHAGQINFVTLTSGQDGSSIYLNGRTVRRARDFRLLGENDTLAGYRAYLGNSLDIVSPWSGDMFGFAIYGKELTEAEVLRSHWRWTRNTEPSAFDDTGLVARYVFNGESGAQIQNTVGTFNTLIIPSQLVYSQKILAKPSLYRMFANDIILNVVGFIPLGVVLALWLRRTQAWSMLRVFVIATILAGCLSLVVELLQAYLPTRNSSQLDLICNTLGTMAGTAGFYLIAKLGIRSARN